MKVGVYSMRDQLTGFMSPTFELNDQIAVRNFSFALKKPDTLLFASAKDFDLCKIGEFDSETGALIPMDPKVICQGIAVVKGMNKDEIQKQS